ncbi:MAG: hypothetical protein ACREMT_08880 [Vulcanimicrobiaceae bacterium]
MSTRRISARRLLALVAASTAIGTAKPAFADRADECASTAETAADDKDAGKLRASFPLFEACAAEDCPHVVRDDCRKALEDLRENAPKIVVHVRDRSGNDMPDASVDIDGLSVSGVDRARGILIDPGSHVVRASRAPLPAVSRSILVAATDRTRSIDIVVGAPPASSSSTSSSPGPANHTAAYVVGGIGAAGLAAFAVLGTWTYADYNHQRSTCGSRCDPNDVSALETRAHVADIVLGVGVVALAAAVVLYVTAPRAQAAPRTAVLAW